MNSEESVEHIPDASTGDIPTASESETQIDDDSLAQAPVTRKIQESGSTGNIELIMDIPVTLSMELGRTRISIRDLLAMNPGAVIELQRLASEPMEILVNGTLVAHGEAVKVRDRYGVRLTSVVTASERLKQVGG